MAAVTVTQDRNDYSESRELRFFTISGNNGDTLVTGMKTIDSFQATPTTNITLGATKSGGTLTFLATGAFAAEVTVFGT